MQVTCLDGALVAGKVLMVYGAGEEVSDSFLVIVSKGSFNFGGQTTRIVAARMVNIPVRDEDDRGSQSRGSW